VNVGSTQWKNSTQKVKVSEFVPHPNFNFQTIDYDYAYIALEEPLKLDKTSVSNEHDSSDASIFSVIFGGI